MKRTNTITRHKNAIAQIPNALSTEATTPLSQKLAGVLIVIGLSVFVYYRGAQGITSNISATQPFAWGFQVACAGISWLLIIIQSHGVIRVSNPGFYILAWLSLYLLWPSYALLTGDEYFTGRMKYDDEVAQLFLYHGQFFIGVTVAFSIVSRNIRQKTIFVPTSWLYRGRHLLGMMLLPTLLESTLRFAQTGSPLPTTSYGDAWSNVFDYYEQAASAGGAAKLIAQIQSKTSFFLLVGQGLAIGLTLAEGVIFRKMRLLCLSSVACFLLILLTFGAVGRGGTLLAALIGVYICDRIAGPLKWRNLAAAGVLILLTFEFYGSFRALRIHGLITGASMSLQGLREPGDARFSEFFSMLPKEELGIKIFKSETESWRYLLNSVVSVIPSQIAPWKTSIATTGGTLSLDMLGVEATSYAGGGGVAGAIIVDGFRFLGAYGNIFLGLLFGIIYGALYSWENRQINGLKIWLVAGASVYSLTIVRSDLGGIITLILYYVALPYLAIKMLFPARFRRLVQTGSADKRRPTVHQKPLR